MSSHSNPMPTLAGRLAELRAARGWSQQELAQRAHTSLFSISKIERGIRHPTFELACRLADALGVPVDELRRPAGEGRPLVEVLEGDQAVPSA